MKIRPIRPKLLPHGGNRFYKLGSCLAMALSDQALFSSLVHLLLLRNSTDHPGPDFSFHLLIFLGFIQYHVKFLIGDFILLECARDMILNGVQLAFGQDSHFVMLLCIRVEPAAGELAGCTCQPTAERAGLEPNGDWCSYDSR